MDITKRLLFLLCLLVWAGPGWAAIARNDSGTNFVNNDPTAATSLSLTTFTVSAGSNQCLFGFLHTRGAVTNPAMTWNSVSMTQIGSGVSFNNTAVYIFKLSNPDTGNQTMVGSQTESVITAVGAVNFSGMDSSCAVDGDTVTNTGNGAPTTGSITSASGDGTLAGITCAGGFVASEPATSLYTSNGTFIEVSASYETSGSSHTFTWGDCFSDFSAIGVHIKAFTATVSGSGLMLLGVGR